MATLVVLHSALSLPFQGETGDDTFPTYGHGFNKEIYGSYEGHPAPLLPFNIESRFSSGPTSNHLPSPSQFFLEPGSKPLNHLPSKTPTYKPTTYRTITYKPTTHITPTYTTTTYKPTTNKPFIPTYIPTTYKPPTPQTTEYKSPAEPTKRQPIKLPPPTYLTQG